MTEKVRVVIQCEQCGKKFPINEIAGEELLPAPYNSVTVGFLLCPNCGLLTRTYYLPEILRHEQERLNKALAAYEADKSEKAWKKYEQHLAVYQNNFEAAQEKYKAIMETESGRKQVSQV